MSPVTSATYTTLRSGLAAVLCVIVLLFGAAVPSAPACKPDSGADASPAVLWASARCHLDNGDLTPAYEALQHGILLAETAADAQQAAPLFNDLGRVYMAFDEPLYALAAFNDARRLAAPDDNAFAVSAAVNFVRAWLDAGQPLDPGTHLAALAARIETVDDDTLRARLYLSVGSLYRDARIRYDGPAVWRKRAQNAYAQALDLAESLDNAVLTSHALGYLGRLYEDERRWSSALRYSREAALTAQQSGPDPDLYRWQWQSARILNETGKTREALAAYSLAAESLDSVRLAVAERSYSSFGDDVAPLYFEYADLLLRQSDGLESPDAVQRTLREARDALEKLKAAEVEDYFQDECAVGERNKRAAQAAGNTAILYPVVFAGRVELLLDLGGTLTRHTVPVGAGTVERHARALRFRFEDPQGGADFRPYAEALYDWLIRPIDSALARAGVDTLVVVPGGALRTIPIAALHDGDAFLVERYAVVTSPGLTLTVDDRPGAATDAYVQVNGLTDAVQGFPPLPHVDKEISSITALYTADVNRNDTFQARTLEDELAEKPYDFVHVATHGQFHRDRRRSFLLTHDELITMDRLESLLGLRRYVSEPVDLLFLSACQTAAGDERAALGLAGVAVKSGADSVVASLWLINDASTADLVAAFYRALKRDGNKAQALRTAQRSLLADTRYAHPNYWAPFLLIGNWQ